jgi:hypothetical protein
MPSTTVNGRQTARTTSGTFVSISVTAAPPYGKFSVHDCVDPGQVSALNCIFPQNFCSPDGKTVKNGIVVHTLEPGGTFVVNHTA